MTFSHSLICCPVFRGCRGCFFCHPSQGFAYLFGLPCKLGLKSKHINVHLLGSTSQAKSPCQTQKSNIRKPAKAFLTYNDMKLFRKKHVNTCDVFHKPLESAVLAYVMSLFFPLLYQHLMHSAPWSDSISATNAPGTTSTFLCFQLPTQVLQAFQSANPYPASLNDMVSHGDHVGLPKTFTKKITMKVKR